MDLKGNNDLLSITRPDIIAAIHRQYLEAGADIVETNTFNANAVSMADYGLESDGSRAEPGRREGRPRGRRRVRGRAPGPAAIRRGQRSARRTGPCSLAIDVNRPGFARVTIRRSRGRLLRTGARRCSTAAWTFCSSKRFSTRSNAKAALFAIEETFERAGRRVPVMVSVTIMDRSGRTLSGQTVEAFWNSMSHVDLLSVGINCALGAREMRPYIEELSRIAPVRISAIPNAGLAERVRRFRRDAARRWPATCAISPKTAG